MLLPPCRHSPVRDSGVASDGDWLEEVYAAREVASIFSFHFSRFESGYDLRGGEGEGRNNCNSRCNSSFVRGGSGGGSGGGGGGGAGAGGGGCRNQTACKTNAMV